jgi:phosphoserine phosphatase RsbU/P
MVMEGRDGNKILRVLVADDDAGVRNCLARALRLKGFYVDEAANGQEVLDQAGKNKPDIIILDGMMPVMSGYKAFVRLRANPELKHIPVILCAATDIEEIKRQIAGFDDYIPKPFFIDDVCERISLIIGKKNSPDHGS